MYDNRPIGVIDSGVGGLTVAKEFTNILPKESIIYLGDNINVPYGNKTEEEIYRLTKDMIDFLIKKDVKLIAVACNTISSLLDKYFLDFNIPIISIIEPVTNYVISQDLKKVGVLATNFTIKSATYERLLKGKNKDIQVISEACPTLAGLIDNGDYTDKEIETIIDLHMNNILNQKKVEDIILGCTHYPIVMEKFHKISSNINFINPAYEQVLYIKEYLEKQGKVSNLETFTFEIYTTGQKEIYIEMINLLSTKLPNKIEIVNTKGGF